jgi:hypothetical protein
MSSAARRDKETDNGGSTKQKIQIQKEYAPFPPTHGRAQCGALQMRRTHPPPFHLPLMRQLPGQAVEPGAKRGKLTGHHGL